MRRRDRFIGLIIMVLGGVVSATMKMRFILLLAMAVLPLLLKRGMLTARIALGFTFVLAGIGAGSLPLVDAVKALIDRAGYERRKQRSGQIGNAFDVAEPNTT